MNITLLIIGWIICGVIHYGLMFAYWQGEYPTIATENYKHDRESMIMISTMGPAALLAALLFLSFRTFKHGFKFK